MFIPNWMKNKVGEYSRKYQLDIAYIIKNEFWSYLGLGITLVFGLVSSVAFARLASQEVFGQYNLILSILGVVALISMPGLNTAVLRSVARGYDGSYRQAVKLRFLWSSLGIPILLGVGAYYYFYSTQIIGIALMISSVFFPFVNAPNAWNNFLVGKKRFDLSTVFGSLQAAVSAVAIIVMLLLDATHLVGIMIAYLLSNALVNYLLFRRSLRYAENQSADDDCRRYGYFLTGANVVGTIGSYIDKILIGTILGAPQLAVYAIAIMIPIRLKDMIKIVWNPFTPKISEHDISMGEIKGRLKRLAWPFIILVIMGAVLYGFFIDDILLMLYGSKYQASGQYAQLMLIWVLLTVPEGLLGTVVIAKKHMRAIVLSGYIFPFLSVGIICVFIYYWGVAGAVWGLITTKAMRVAFLVWGMGYAEWQ